MSVAFSVENPVEHFVSIEEVNGVLELRVHGDTHSGTTAVIRIAVDPADLVRALISTSPGIGTAIGVLVSNAMRRLLSKKD